MEVTDLRVLIIEDDSEYSAILKNLIISQGVSSKNIHEVNSIFLAKDKLKKEENYDILISDTNLGYVLGYQACSDYIKMDKDMLIVGMSAHKEYRGPWIKAGAHGFFDKMKAGDSLIEIIHTTIQNKQKDIEYLPEDPVSTIQ